MSNLISREEAIQVLSQRARILQGEYGDLGGACSGAMKIIESLPSAEPEPERKKGKWNFIGDNMFECTHCRVVYTTQQLNGLRNYAEDPYAPRFCPNCGTRMEIRNNE